MYCCVQYVLKYLVCDVCSTLLMCLACSVLSAVGGVSTRRDQYYHMWRNMCAFCFVSSATCVVQCSLCFVLCSVECVKCRVSE